MKICHEARGIPEGGKRVEFLKKITPFVGIVIAPAILGIVGLAYGAGSGQELLLATSALLVAQSMMSSAIKLLRLRGFQGHISVPIILVVVPLSLGIAGLAEGAEEGSKLLLATSAMLVTQGVMRLLLLLVVKVADERLQANGIQFLSLWDWFRLRM